MTDSLKLVEMQRTSIEFERQRHLANWFIKSSPHMPNPSSSQNINGNNIISSSPNGNCNGNGNGSNCSNNTNNNSNHSKAQKLNSSSTKNGTITPTAAVTTTTNPLFLLMSSSGHKPPPPPAAILGPGPPPPPLPQTYHPHHPGSSLHHHPHPHHHHHHPLIGNLQMSTRSQLFTSQTNLPLQIVTSSAIDGHKPKLRRFNSHDTSSNMFSVAEFENARLARRNEIELKQRQQQHQRSKISSLSSGGGDCSTGDSKGSKYSNDSQSKPISADVFLEKYSLPRIVKVSNKSQFIDETLQSSSSHGSSSSNSSSFLLNKSSNSSNNNNSLKQNGEIFLLYRHLKQRKIYHAIGNGHRKKGYMIPQEFPGYFSLVSEKGSPTATMYTTLVQLVRERVYKFVSVDNLPAFTESQSTSSADALPSRTHYVKSTARGGQVFRLLAVFEDGKHHQDGNNTSTNKTNSCGREKEKGRYAQLLSENRQILYVSLSTKGKFYEIEPSIPQLLQKAGMITSDTKKKINPDCVHRISNLINSDHKNFPVHLKFISGPSLSSSSSTSASLPDFVYVTKVTIENILIACPIINDIEMMQTTATTSSSSSLSSSLCLKKLHVTPQMTLIKCCLGFENEQHMLANQNIQNILKFCQFNCDNYLKIVELEIITPEQRSSSKFTLTGSLHQQQSHSHKSRTESLKILRPLNLPKLLRREKSVIAHEKEDSIIFLSKNDLANLEASNKTRNCGSSTISDGGGANENRITEKMKVFQPTKKKWFRRGGNGGNNNNEVLNEKVDINAQAKRMSMQRYNDMSKLLQERFGDAALINGNESIVNDNKSTSEVTGNHCDDKLKTGTTASESSSEMATQFGQIQKSFSLQEVDHLIDKPDLVPLENFSSEKNINDNEKYLNSNGKDEICSNHDNGSPHHHQQQSFISEKMYSEFHVKTKQYSKSSSSLNQLLQFAVQPKKQSITNKSRDKKEKFCCSKNLEFSLTDDIDIDNDEMNSATASLPSSPIVKGPTTIIDDLPYSSVRDSLLTSESIATSCDMESLNYIDDVNGKILENQSTMIDYYTKENIYAEICGSENSNMTMETCNNGDAITSTHHQNNRHCQIVEGGGGAAAAISRVQITSNILELNPSIRTRNAVEYLHHQEEEHQRQLELQNNHDGANHNDNIYNTLN